MIQVQMYFTESLSMRVPDSNFRCLFCSIWRQIHEWWALVARWGKGELNGSQTKSAEIRDLMEQFPLCGDRVFLPPGNLKQSRSDYSISTKPSREK